MKTDTVILTPNRRLAATLLRQHNTGQSREGLTSWATPIILPLQTWLQQCWQRCMMHPLAENALLLSPAQEMLLWEKILSESPEQALLLQTANTAQLASKAWGLLKLWQVNLQHPMLGLTEDGQAFTRWAAAFQACCIENQWLDAASLPEKIMTALQAGQLSVPGQLWLAGFTEISPQFQSLLDVLDRMGCSITQNTPICTPLLPVACTPLLPAACPRDPETGQRLSGSRGQAAGSREGREVQAAGSREGREVQAAGSREVNAKSAHKICLADEETEIRSMARWAKAILQQSLGDGEQFIGCIIPRLDTLRDQVLQIFSEIFSAPDTLTAHHGNLPFNISAGKKLSDWPIIRTALLLCTACVRPLTDEESARLQYSPFSGQKPAGVLPPDLTLPSSRWVKHISEFLNASGWPGQRSLNSDEYQAAQRWLDLLYEYATFDLLFPEQDLKSAISGLQRLSDQTLYQPQTPLAPVQISGLLEAAGQPFSHLWIMGMDDSQWPFPPRPNPLIPLPLQRTLQMPHATAERELHYCKQIFQQLRNDTTHLMCSYAGQLDDSPLRPASLLQDIPPVTLEDLPLLPHTPPAETVFASAAQESFQDELAPPVTEAETLRGGSRILRHQAACPFRAFAEVRLHARPTETEGSSLDAKDRGTLLHKTLESLWKHLGDSHTLQQQSSESLQALCEQFARDALLTCTRQSPEDSRYLQMEWERISRLASAWLTLEKNRPPFRVVACETPLTVTLSGLTFDLRMDRVDELEDGSQMIIDYKTGKHASTNDWMGDRPAEPQLPLYCISAPETVSALAFGTLHPETIKLTGLSANETGIRHLRTANAWHTQIRDWQQTLTRLAEDFCAGKANVDPKEGPPTCEHCHLQTLCRIHEMPKNVTG